MGRKEPLVAALAHDCVVWVGHHVVVRDKVRVRASVVTRVRVGVKLIRPRLELKAHSGSHTSYYEPDRRCHVFSIGQHYHSALNRANVSILLCYMSSVTAAVTSK